MSRYDKICTIPNRIIKKDKINRSKDKSEGYCVLDNGYIINSKYKVIKRLGQGGYSIVYLVENILTNEYFAIKTSISKETRENKYNEVGNEIAKFELVQGSEYFVQMIENFDLKYEGRTYKCIVMELVGCDILQIIKKYEYKGLPNFLAKNIIREVTKGLEFLNSKNLGHFDLKPENICLAISQADAKRFSMQSKSNELQCEFLKDVSCDIKIKIIDLGGILDTTTKIDFLPTTYEYRAYEGLIKGDPAFYDNNYHIFSLGSILFELITGYQLFYDFKNKSDHIQQISEMFTEDELVSVDIKLGNKRKNKSKNSLNSKIVEFTETNILDPNDLRLLDELLLKMLYPDPEFRIKPAGILSSNWLNDMTDYSSPRVSVTTAQPQVTTAQPQVTTAQPQVTTTQPQVTTPQPQVTTPPPQVTTPPPQVTTPQPQVTTAVTPPPQVTTSVTPPPLVTTAVTPPPQVTTTQQKKFKLGDQVMIDKNLLQSGTIINIRYNGEAFIYTINYDNIYNGKKTQSVGERRLNFTPYYNINDTVMIDKNPSIVCTIINITYNSNGMPIYHVTYNKPYRGKTTDIITQVSRFDDFPQEEMNNKIDNYFKALKLNEIMPIVDTSNSINIEGYDKSIYGQSPIFTLDSIYLNNYDKETYNDSNKVIKCVDASGVQKNMRFTNPSFTKNFKIDGKPIYFEDCYLSDLPHPTSESIMTNFTYVIVKNQITEKFNIRFGLVNDLTELGVKHSILGNQDHIIVAGELAIKLYGGSFEYIININSSKVRHDDIKLNNINRKPRNYNKGNSFYYILMINIAISLLRLINPSQNIRLAKYIEIKVNDTEMFNEVYTDRYLYYDHSKTPEENKIELLFDYYKIRHDNEPCPVDTIVTQYNSYGSKNRGKSDHGMCIEILDNTNFTSMKKISKQNHNYECKIKQKYLKEYINQKYLKYKEKFLELKNTIKT